MNGQAPALAPSLIPACSQTAVIPQNDKIHARFRKLDTVSLEIVQREVISGICAGWPGKVLAFIFFWMNAVINTFAGFSVFSVFCCCFWPAETPPDFQDDVSYQSCLL